MFKLTLVTWVDGHLVSASPLHWKKTNPKLGNTKLDGSLQLAGEPWRCVATSSNLNDNPGKDAPGGKVPSWKRKQDNQKQPTAVEPSWLELVRHCAKMPLAPSPIFINFAILGKDGREFPLDCDSFSEIWSWPAGEGSRQTDWQRDSVFWEEESRLSGLCRKGRKRPVLSDRNLGGQSYGGRGKEVEEQTNYRHCVCLDAPTDWLAHVSEALGDGNQLIILINFSSFVLLVIFGDHFKHNAPPRCWLPQNPLEFPICLFLSLHKGQNSPNESDSFLLK